MLTAEHLDLPLTYEAMAERRLDAGHRALQIFDETTSVVRTVRWVEFYKHESCGKCTPCREGTWWLVQMLRTGSRQGRRARRRHREDARQRVRQIIGGRSARSADGAVAL
jgi:NADH-quinone oxidoreductase subunit F